MLDINSFKDLPTAPYRQVPGGTGWYAKHLVTDHKIAISHEKDLSVAIDGHFYLREVMDLNCRKDGQKYRLIVSNLEVGVRPSTHAANQPHCIMHDLSKDYKWVNFLIATFSVYQLTGGLVMLVALLTPKELVPVGGAKEE